MGKGQAPGGARLVRLLGVLTGIWICALLLAAWSAWEAMETNA